MECNPQRYGKEEKSANRGGTRLAVGTWMGGRPGPPGILCRGNLLETRKGRPLGGKFPEDEQNHAEEENQVQENQHPDFGFDSLFRVHEVIVPASRECEGSGGGLPIRAAPLRNPRIHGA